MSHRCGYDCALTALVTARDDHELARAAELARSVVRALGDDPREQRQVETMRAFYRHARERIRA